ncbi:hypothetical protein LY78DRAFT_393029 [Colletotrichum sublineola]|nr:hypothetical protein LY78DRAFT_393029 [Colletotrichum sublineola]
MACNPRLGSDTLSLSTMSPLPGHKACARPQPLADPYNHVAQDCARREEPTRLATPMRGPARAKAGCLSFWRRPRRKMVLDVVFRKKGAARRTLRGLLHQNSCSLQCGGLAAAPHELGSWDFPAESLNLFLIFMFNFQTQLGAFRRMWMGGIHR